MMLLFTEIIEKITTTKAQRNEARVIAECLDVPMGDAVHAIIARDNKYVLITRDNHFRKLDSIVKHHRPEDLIDRS